jgi:hypothetical protein
VGNQRSAALAEARLHVAHVERIAAGDNRVRASTTRWACLRDVAGWHDVTATAVMPAARAASIPAGASSITAQAPGGRLNRSAASRKTCGSGTSWCDGCAAEQKDVDLAVCLRGEPGGVFGTCCDNATGECDEDNEIDDCAGDSQRFLADGTCHDLDPPCGVELGACCRDDATCDSVAEGACVESGGQ